MTEVKLLVCLANSRKPGGRCVAGLEIAEDVPPGWIRPVGPPPIRAVSVADQLLADHTDTKLLDGIEVGLVAPEPFGYQRENWRIDPAHSWQKVGQADWGILQQLEQNPAKLWINGYSSARGQNDKVPEHLATDLTSSLLLIHVARVDLLVYDYWDKRVVRAQFQHRGVAYALKVTDPVYESRYGPHLGSHSLGEAFLTVSLAEVHTDHFAYKLVAGIIERALVEDVSRK